LLRLGGLAIALFCIFSFIDFATLSKKILDAEIAFLLPAFVIAALSPLFTSARLKLFLFATGTHIAFSRCLMASWCGLSLNLLIPARGGDLVKFACLRKDGNPPWDLLAGAALLERGFDVLALSLIGLFASLALGLPDAATVTCILAVLTCGGLVLLPTVRHLPVIGRKAENFSEVLKHAAKRKRRLFACFLACCFCWSVNSVIMGLLIKSFDQDVSLSYAFATTPPSIIAGIIPVSLWGVGTRDGALAYLLQDLTSLENALSAGFTYTVVVYWFLGLLGLPFLAAFRNKSPSNGKSSEHS